MVRLVDELKNRARILHRQAQAGDPSALVQLRGLPELREHDEAALATEVKRRHCLAMIAKQLGFAGWPQAAGVLRGDDTSDFGTLLYPKGADVYWNIWSASYPEAREIREQNGGFLLAYRRHFFIAERGFISNLGLDPDDSDWERIGRDWAHPRDPEARERLYAKLIRARVPEVLMES